MINPFTSDAFSYAALTALINNLPYVPQQVGRWLPWNDMGESTPNLAIEIADDGSLSIIQEAPRGTIGSQVARTERKLVPIRVPHYPQFETLLAASVVGVRAAGSENNTEVVDQKINEILMKFERNIQVTKEFVRAAALNGIILKKDGSVSQNLWNIMGQSQIVVPIDLDDQTTDVIAEIIEAKEMSEDEQGAYQGMGSGYKLICGKTFFRKSSRHAMLKKDFEYFNQGAFQRADNREGVVVANDVDIVSYSKGKVGSTTFLAEDEALLCPVIDDMYQGRHAPGDSLAWANTMGLPSYASSEPLPHGKGTEMYGETNYVAWVNRPRSVIKFKLA